MEIIVIVGLVDLSQKLFNKIVFIDILSYCISKKSLDFCLAISCRACF